MTPSPPPPPAAFPPSPPQDATHPPPVFSPSPSIPPQPPENNPPPDFSPSELPLPPSPPVGVTTPPIPEAVAPVPTVTLPVQSPPSPSIPIVAAPISPNDPPHWSPQPSFPSLPPPPPSESPNPLSRAPPSTTLPSSHPLSTHPSYIGLIIGTTIGGVAAVILLIVLIILLICLKKKKINNECPPPKDKPNGVLPLQWKHRFPQQGSNDVPFHWKPFPLLPQLSSSTEDASDNNFTLRSQSSLTGGNFTYDELALATSKFSNDNLLGEGGFGYVHKGILPTGRQIAVKQLKTGSRQGEREFQAEVETISRVHHRHLVSLVGYCMTGAERLLVYEFVPNKTLYIHLHGIRQPVMEWATRMKIAIGSAKGLAYLHEDCNPTIIHRDIKASNILLDNKFEPKVSDFGLAKFFSDTNHDVTHVYTRVVGTFGYLAPEYAASGKVSDRSDTFSFGVVLLELITGRPPINWTDDSLANDSLVTWARPLLTQAMENGKFDLLVDPKLQGNYNGKEMKTMVACAAACVRHSAWRRPHMSQVVRALEGDVSLSDLDEGVRPGKSTLCSPINIPYYNMEEFRLMTDFYTEENDTNSNRNYGSDGTAQIPLDSERCQRAERK